MGTALTGGLITIWSALSGWKRYLLGFSGALGITGFLFSEDPQEPDPGLRAVPLEQHQTDPAFRENGLRSRFAEPAESGDELTSAGPWKDPLMRSYASKIGISFFVALLVGTLLRLFFRGMLTVIVLVSILVAALVHYGVVEPFWTADSELYQESADWVTGQAQALKELAKNHAPSGFAAAAGLFMGIRR